MLLPDEDDSDHLTIGQFTLIGLIAMLAVLFLAVVPGCGGPPPLVPSCKTGTDWSPCGTPADSATCYAGNDPTTAPDPSIHVTECLTTSGLLCIDACATR